MYKVSVIIPVYNVEKYLDKCINSLIKQSCFEKLEIILVNDGSTDNSQNICEKYSLKYNNINLISKENGGVSSARNVGITMATGKYIAFVDADDYVASDFFENMVDTIETYNAELVVYDYYVVYEDGLQKAYRNKSKIEFFSAEETMSEFLKGGPIGINLFDKLYITEIVKKISFDTEIRIGEDLLFIFEYLKRINNCVCIYKPGYYYIQRSGSAMNSCFAEKNFDVLVVAKRILNWAQKEQKQYLDVANAHYIHVAYKTIERAFKSVDYSIYEERISKMFKELKRYSIIKAFHNLSKKQFCGFFLMRISPKVYMFVCKIRKI